MCGAAGEDVGVATVNQVGDGQAIESPEGRLDGGKHHQDVQHGKRSHQTLRVPAGHRQPQLQDGSAPPSAFRLPAAAWKWDLGRKGFKFKVK